MARNKKNQANIDLSNLTDFPDGRIKNNDGSGNGTPVNEKVYGDIHEVFAKLMRLSLKPFNDLPDNEQFGYQYVDALVQLASKNDYIIQLSAQGGKLTIPTNTAILKTNESIVCKSIQDYNSETILKTFPYIGSSIELTCTFEGGNYKNGEYVRITKTAAGVTVTRLPDGAAFATFISEFSYLLAASQIEEDAGIISTKGTTPLTNFTTFSNRVIGAASFNFLATQIANGLMSSADKLKLDNLESDEKNYGTFGPFDVDVGNVNDLYTRTGDVIEAKIVQRTSNGQVVQVTLSNAMDNTQYQPIMSIESKGSIEADNDIKPLLFKTIDTTKFQVYIEETSGSTQNISIHIAVIQR